MSTALVTDLTIFVLALLVGIGFGFAIFGCLQYYFKPEFWISIAVSVLGGLYSAIVPLLDLVKKVYEVRKLRYEVRDLQRKDEAAEREKNSVILAPSVEHVERYGQSETERAINKRFQTDGQILLNPKPWVHDSHDE